MPLLDHFHPPLHGPRRWEGFLHSWPTFIARQLNDGILPADYYAEVEISLGSELDIDVPTIVETLPEPPTFSATVDFSHLDTYEVRVYQDLGGAELRAAIELVSPANKDREGSRRTFAAKCAGYLKQGLGLVIVDVVTSRTANLHEELFETLEVKSRTWKSATGLYSTAYRPVTVRKNPRLEVWPETLDLGKPLPIMPLWLSLDLCVPVRLEESYLETCRSLRISA